MKYVFAVSCKTLTHAVNIHARIRATNRLRHTPSISSLICIKFSPHLRLELSKDAVHHVGAVSCRTLINYLPLGPEPTPVTP